MGEKPQPDQQTGIPDLSKRSLADILGDPDLRQAAQQVGEQAVAALIREDAARERGHPQE
jgi:hypothetical protein